jgi:hypothetical protein
LNTGFLKLITTRIFLLTAIFWILPAFAHPFFVSMTEIIFNEKEKSIQISVRIFTDDFEKELAKDCNCKVDLIAPEKHVLMEPVVWAYFQKVLKISPNNKAVKFQYIGFEKEEESTWTYLEIKNQSVVKELNIENKILHLSQPKQNNLVRFKKKDFDKTIQLSYPQSVGKF